MPPTLSTPARAGKPPMAPNHRYVHPAPNSPSIEPCNSTISQFPLHLGRSTPRTEEVHLGQAAPSAGREIMVL